jgi:hypothetical protein
MSHSDDETDSTEKTNYLKPYTANGQEILYLDNDATLGGILHEVGRFWKRKNLFQTYLKHGVVPVGSRIATDDLRSVAFIEELFNDPHSFENPAGPNTGARIMRYDLATPSKKFAFDVSKADAVDRKLYFKGEHYIEQTESLMLTSLTHVIAKATNRDTLLDNADGVGTDLLKALRDLFEKASPRAKAVVAARLNAIVSRGITTRVLGESLKAYLSEYKLAKINLEVSERPSDAAELSMMNTIAYKSPEIRDLYETKCENNPPKNMAEATAIIESILTSRKLSEDLDEANNPSAPKVPSALEARVAELTALVAELRDPSKTAAAPPPDKPATGFIKAPRGADGKVTHWVTGMQPCKCKKKQPGDSAPGGHLSRDCTTHPPKPKPGQKEPEPAPTGEAPKEARVLEITEGMPADKLTEALNLHFGITKIHDSRVLELAQECEDEAPFSWS